MKDLRKILFPTDLSDLSFAAAEVLASVASRFDAEVYALHVVEPFPGVMPGEGSAMPPGAAKEAERKAMTRLDELLRQNLPGLQAVVKVARHGDPRTQIVRCARELGVDLIVMATHGRTGISHVLLGSVAEQVVRYAGVPVLTVKPKGFAAGLVEQQDIDEQLHVKARP